MRYVKVAWRHGHPDEPILLYSEMDDARWEVRKVEIFRHGFPGYASREGCDRSTRLGAEPIPPLSKIAEDPEFDPIEITKEEFEKVWADAVAVRK
jgi:hypothetical protein